MNTRKQTIRSVISILLTVAMMSVMTHSIAGSADAEEQALEWLDNNGFNVGWDDQKKRFVSIGWAGFDVASFRISDLGFKFGNLEKLEKS